MTENRRYYYLKLKEYFFNSETMMILESMQDGLLYSNLLLKMYLMSLKSGGILLLGDHFPHTPQTIATCTRHQIGTVERGLKIFLQLGLIEILTDGAYYMTDIQLLIGQSSTEGERKKRERSRLQRQKLLPSGGVDICPPNSRVDKCPPILEKEKDIPGGYLRGPVRRGVLHPPAGTVLPAVGGRHRPLPVWTARAGKGAGGRPVRPQPAPGVCICQAGR